RQLSEHRRIDQSQPAEPLAKASCSARSPMEPEVGHQGSETEAISDSPREVPRRVRRSSDYNLAHLVEAETRLRLRGSVPVRFRVAPCANRVRSESAGMAR